VLGVFNNHITDNFPRSVPAKEFLKSVKIWWRYRENLVGTFLWLIVQTVR